MKRLSKICIVCGREIQWRKKWQDSWPEVKYCSHACRKAGLKEIDLTLEKAILEHLRSSKSGASICPSEVARKLAGSDDQRRWRPLLEPARKAARRLAHRGKISILQGGKTVDPSKFKGPVRLKRKD